MADSIARCRARWGSAAPIALGGIYATLLPGHARRHSGADIVFEGQAFESFPRWLRERFPARAAAIHAVPENLDSWPRPAVDLCHGRKALPLLMSLGCPGRCAYCASALLAPRRLRRSAESAHAELADHAERFGAEDIAFFDDALLTESARWFEPFLDRVIAQGPRVRFHAPNGLNCAEIHPGLAGKMKAAGFETVRLSLETIATERLREWRRSGGAEAFARAVVALRRAGFRRDQIGAYIMGGMPGQTSEETRRTIEFAHDAGATPYLNEFSPIPGTLGMERAIAQADMRRPGSGRELIEEPLWQNNSLYFLRGDSYPAEEFIELKRLTRRLRSAEPVGKALASGGANAVFLPAAPHGDFRQAADRPFFQEDC
ncbi:MAG: Radical SAM superfamily protein [candidate division BRC1 bacterium ADurb.BinA364]|nr:MAG: Radical SAM superfamily protein [candidate division BRC1 bacterium ADurb.BinA364]